MQNALMQLAMKFLHLCTEESFFIMKLLLLSVGINVCVCVCVCVNEPPLITFCGFQINKRKRRTNETNDGWDERQKQASNKVLSLLFMIHF